VTWVDVAARAAGRCAHLLGEPALVAIETSRDRAALDDALRVAYRRAGEDLAIADRWAGARRSALAVIFDDEDRHSLRALVRGLAAGVPVERRLAAAVPTPSLPEGALRELAQASSIAELATALAQRKHPLAAAFASTETPSLVTIELAMARTVIARAGRDHRGGEAIARYVEELVDGENATAALELAARGQDLAADEVFLEGGRALGRDEFLAAASASPEAAAVALARVFTRTPLAAAFDAATPEAIDDAVLAWQLDTQTALRRVDPTGVAPLLYLVLRRRGELRRIRRAAWRHALAGESS
jgi:vacuolar-type H+-ATPase subunit C/Vma6